ncbi:MAG: ABC-F family ATP-binding cassette domain-containing protein [Bacteroidales bacterium]
MNILTVENLSKSFGEKLLFENITFGIETGQKIALIARNGAGKSSLIKIMTGEDQPDSGQVSVGNDVRISYLPQNPEMDVNAGILDYLFDTDSETVQVVREYEKLNNPGNENAARLQEVITRMDELQAWNFEAKIREILGKFDIRNLDQPVGQLSGGMRKKVALSKALIEEADLLILDEPTNHLDVEMIEWLENYLKRQNLAVLVVTHDRYFLDNVCNTILEIDNQSIYKYKGNYAYFLEKKAERQAIEKIELEKSRSLYSKELEWMRRQPQARATKAKAREDAFYDLEDKLDTGPDEKSREFGVKMQRLGGKILELNYINKSYGNQKILQDFSYTFNRGDRVGVIGKNGSGKTTLLRIIVGEIKPDKGRIVKGQTVEFGYFRQDGMELKEDKRIIDIVKEIAEQVEMKKGTMTPAQFLTYFNFRPEIHYNYHSMLSGGEKRRLYLLTTLLRNPNFLILDEPTNDLDIDTLNRLEEFLQNYDGCLMIVSHDRYFMDHMVDHMFVFRGEGDVKDYWGNYSEYQRLKKLEEKQQKIDKPKPSLKKDTRQKAASNKPTYKQIKEYEQLEQEIDQLEKHKAVLMEKLNRGEGTPDQLREWSEEIAGVMQEIDLKSDRWLELSELMNNK